MAIQVVKIREFLGHSQAVYTICKGHDMPFFYSGSADGLLVRWQLDEEDGLSIARQNSAIYALFSREGQLLSGTNNGVLSVFDTGNHQLIRQLQLSGSPVFDITEFGDFLMVATGEGTLFVLDKDFSVIKTIRLSNKSLRKMTVMDQQLAVAGSEGIIWVLDAGLNVVEELREQEMSVFALAFNFAGKTLISGGRDARLNLYRGNYLLKSIPAHLLHIHHISMNPEMNMYLSCSMDKTIKLWSAEDDELLKVIDHEKYGGHTSSVNKILWFDKNNFISCSDDRTLKCFEIREK